MQPVAIDCQLKQYAPYLIFRLAVAVRALWPNRQTTFLNNKGKDGAVTIEGKRPVVFRG
jgi:hypothetical protein